MEASFLAGAVQAHYKVLNSAISIGKTKGLVSEASMYVSNGSIIVGGVSGVFGCGVSFSETGDTTVQPPSLNSHAAQYTLCWQLDEGLFSKPELVWISGLQEPGFSDYALVVGWLLYSGSSLTLSTSMLVSAPGASVPRVLRSIDSFTLASDLKKLVGSEAQVSSSSLWTTLTSTTSSTKYYSLTYEVQSDSSPATCIAIDVGLTAQAFVRSWLIRKGTSDALIQGGQVNGSLEESTQLLPLTQSKILPWERFQVKFDFVLAPGATMKIGSIAFTNEVVTSQRTR